MDTHIVIAHKNETDTFVSIGVETYNKSLTEMSNTPPYSFMQDASGVDWIVRPLEPNELTPQATLRDGSDYAAMVYEFTPVMAGGVNIIPPTVEIEP